jgi:hypothetical protein
MVRYVTIPKFAELSGYTPAAIRSKIRDGIWRQDLEWRKAPDGRILIDVDGYQRWVEGDGILKPVQKPASRGQSPAPLR